jgi:hypothetical protein
VPEGRYTEKKALETLIYISRQQSNNGDRAETS